MKKASYIFAVLTLTLLFACKKNRTCSCEYDYQGADTTWTSTKDTIIEKSTKKDAVDKCAGMSKSSTILSESLEVSCELKE